MKQVDKEILPKYSKLGGHTGDHIEEVTRDFETFSKIMREHNKKRLK